MKPNLGMLGGRLGVGLVVAGFVLVFLGWNGAASVDRVQGQFPYLLSGGVAGLCLVVVGVGVIIVQAQRADRAELQATLEALREALERLSGGGANGGPAAHAPEGSVVAGADSFHRPGCLLVEGRTDVEVLPDAATALGRGLNPCRVCNPDAAELELESAPAGGPRRKPLRAKS